MAHDKILLNFRIDRDLKHRLDRLCLIDGRTKTLVLNELVRSYVLARADELTNQKQVIANLDDALNRPFASGGSRYQRPREWH